jgi:hypothetical protein
MGKKLSKAKTDRPGGLLVLQYRTALGRKYFLYV